MGVQISKNEVSYYDQECIWNRYEEDTVEIRRAVITIDLIPIDVKSVLDIGCGNGIITNRINKPLTVGIDFARTPLKNLKTHAIQCSINSLPIKKRKFDLVIVTEVLEHLEDIVYSKAISEIKSLDSKYILITVPYNENINLNFCKCEICGNLFNSCHHRRIFDENSFQEVFPEYNVKIIKYETYRVPPNVFLLKLKQKFGAYSYSELAICDKCGSRPVRPNEILRVAFGGLNRIDRLFKSALRVKKPYHFMILLKRNP